MADDFGFVPTPDTSASPTEDFGFVATEPNTKPMKDLVRANIARHDAEHTIDAEAKPVVAEDWVDALAAGWEMSVSGLMAHGKPSIQLNENSGAVAQAASGIGMLAGDFPVMVGAGALGGLVASPTIAGAPVAAIASANAVPPMIRKIMMDHYEKGDIQDFPDFWNRFAGATWEGIKGGTIGVATLGAGKYVGGAASKVGGEVFSGMAKTGAEIATMVGVGSALEGHMPSANEVISAGIVLGGLHGAVKIAPKIREQFVKTGETPATIIEKTDQDIIYKQEMLSENQLVPDPDKPIQALKPDGTKQEIPPLKKTLKQKAKTELKQMLRTAQRLNDDTADILFLQEDMLNQGKLLEVLPADQNAYMSIRSRKSASAIQEHFNRNGTVDFNTMKKNGESLQAVLKDVPRNAKAEFSPEEQHIIDRIDPEELKKMGPNEIKFVTYLLAKRAIEKSKQFIKRGDEMVPIKVGIDIDKAEAVVKANMDKYESVAKRYSDFWARAMKYVADSGRISQDQYKAIVEKNKDYVSMARVLEPDAFKDKKGFANPFAKMKGNETLKFKNPIASQHQMLLSLIKSAEENKTKLNLIKLQDIATETGGAELIQKVPGKTKPVNVLAEEISKELDKQGIEHDPEEIKGFAVFRKSHADLGPNEFEVFNEGKREVYAVHEDYADAAKALNYQVKPMNLLQRIIALPKRTLRAGITLAPDFTLTNAFKDQITGTIMSDTKMKPFVSIYKGVSEIMGNSEDWQKFLLSGGVSGGLADVEKFWSVNPYGLDKKFGGISTMWNVVKDPLAPIEYISSVIENTPRFIEAQRTGGLRPDATKAELKAAGFKARNITVDFDKSGKLMRVLSLYDPFLNASLQGSENEVLRLFKNPKRALIAGGATITLPSLLLYALNRNDSRQKEASNWEKNAFFLIHTDKWEKAGSQADYQARPEDLRKVSPNGDLYVNNGVTFRLRKPYLFGMLFGSVIERTLDRYFDKNPNAFHDFSENLWSAFLPDNVDVFLPTAAVPVIEQQTNYIPFTDRPLVNNYMEKFLPEDRYTPYTSETAKQVAKIIGHLPGKAADEDNTTGPTLTSPVVIDNYIYTWGGTNGRYVTQLLDKALKTAGVGPQVERAAWDWSDVPILRSFISKTAKVNPESVARFYRRSDFAEKVLTSIKAAQKLGDQARVDELMAKYPQNLERLNGIRQAIGEANKALNMINLDPKMTPIEKRQLMDKTYYDILKMAQLGNQMLDLKAEQAQKGK